MRTSLAVIAIVTGGAAGYFGGYLREHQRLAPWDADLVVPAAPECSASVRSRSGAHSSRPPDRSRAR